MYIVFNSSLLVIVVGDVVVVEAVVVIDSSTVVGTSLVAGGGGVGSGSFVGSIVDGSNPSVVNCVVSGTRVLDFWIEDCEKKITFKQKNVF